MNISKILASAFAGGADFHPRGYFRDTHGRGGVRTGIRRPLTPYHGPTRGPQIDKPTGCGCC